MKRRAFIRAATLTAAVIATPVLRAARARIVIVGGGFGGSACALLLKHAQPSLDVTLVDPDARYVTCPLSNDVIVGARSIDSLTLTRAGLARAGVRFVRARATALDAEARSIRLDDGTRLAYDRCIVAPGIRFLWGTPEDYDEAAAETMAISFDALTPIRLAAPFEALRDRSDTLLKQSGARPKIWLANLGKPSDFTARATFAKSLFEAGGIEAIDSDGFSDPAALAVAFKASGAQLACLCSSDAVYAEHAAAAAKALQAAGAKHIYLAGRAGDKELEFRAAGVGDFVIAGGNAIATLEGAYATMVTP